MSIDIQKAGLWKRIAAWMLDGILFSVLAAGCAFGLTVLLDYDAYDQTLQDAYAAYETEYGVTFDIDLQTYEAMTEAERQNYDDAYLALTNDEDAMHAYNMLLNLSLIITTVGILAAMLILEFALPLVLGNGSTVGKKIFGLGIIRKDGVMINTLQLFTRTLLGKFTIETMIPVYLILMMFWGIMDVTGTVILCGLGIAQIVIYARSQTNAQIHDLLAGTAVVDIASQRVFRRTDDLIAYQKKIAAERAAQQDY